MSTQYKIIDSNVEQVKTVLMLEKEKQEFIENFPVSKIFTTVKGKTLTRKRYSFEVDFSSPETQAVIFTHGKSNYKIWFLNAKKKVCVVDKAIYKDNTIYLTVTIDAKNHQTQTYMTLDRFLYLVEKGDFKITLDRFVEAYLRPITDSNYYKKKLQEFDNKIAEAKTIQA